MKNPKFTEGEYIPINSPAESAPETTIALLDPETLSHFRTRWNEIQGKFVDEPRTAVEQADALVSDVIRQISRVFSSERSALENEWRQGQDISTEDLRKALQRYRSFFNRPIF